ACANIPILKGTRRYSHCVYTGAFMGQWVSPQAIVAEGDVAAATNGAGQAVNHDIGKSIVLKLPQHLGEAAFFGLTPSESVPANGDALQRQLRVLGSYFHEHILRLH